MSLLYPYAQGSQEDGDDADWAMAYALASYWGLASVQTSIAQKLGQRIYLPIDRAVWGRILRIDAWVNPGVTDIYTKAIATGLTARDMDEILSERERNLRIALSM
ncbi:hypothetical protein PENSPDRAFT_693836 [Peniophora sp. CONT]|nr:hypothetical protein PENSPDRAFT_693836 [Peniophora sp. CONT]